ncbi:MAG: hypothetical protein A4E28_02320 [Methanocella sp. PtaU1.Bin125]|nr:MAG: hypothetical protein A4E28_02320 [Methanocella sp. PtaU1.Bin125]
MKFSRILLAGLAVLFVSAASAWSLPSITELIEKQDERFELKSDMTCKVNIVQRKANQGDKIIESIFYRRDRDDSFLIIMIAPDADKGNGYLRVGDNFWMYRVNTRTFQHINRDESISGTDMKSGDFEKRKMSELYKPALDANGKEKISSEKLGQIPVYKFEITAKVSDVTYPKEIFWVRQDNYLPLKVQAFSLSRVMASYMGQLPPLNGKKAVVFVTKGLALAFTGGNQAIKKLTKGVESKGGKVVGTGIIMWGSKDRDRQIDNVVETLVKSL